MERSSEDKVLAGISHLGIVLGWTGLVVALIIYLIRKDQSMFIRRSSRQALGYQICALVIMQVLVFLFGGSLLLGIFSSHVLTLGIVGSVLFRAVNLALIALGILGAIKAFVGESFRYPLIGNFIERL